MDTSTVQDSILPREPSPKLQKQEFSNKDSEPYVPTSTKASTPIQYAQTNKQVNLQSLDKTDDTMFHTLYYAVTGQYLTTEMVRD